VLLGIEHDWVAYCLDSAVAAFGTALQADLDEVEGKTRREVQRKREGVLRRYIPELSKAQKFKDPGKR
jgi:hypothetical protein